MDHLKEIYLLTDHDEERAMSLAIKKNYSLYIGLQQLKHFQSIKSFKKLLQDVF
jgi:hypothetical protein